MRAHDACCHCWPHKRSCHDKKVWRARFMCLCPGCLCETRGSDDGAYPRDITDSCASEIPGFFVFSLRVILTRTDTLLCPLHREVSPLFFLQPADGLRMTLAYSLSLSRLYHHFSSLVLYASSWVCSLALFSLSADLLTMV